MAVYEEIDGIYYNDEIILKENLRYHYIVAIDSHFTYDEIKPFSNGLAAVRRDEKWGFVNMQGEEVIPCIYEVVDDFSENLAGVRTKRGRWGFINKDGQIVIKDKYLDVQPFSEGLAAVFSAYDNKWGFINKQGHLVIPFEYDAATEFEDGVCVVEVDHKLTLIDKNNNILSAQDEIDYLARHMNYKITGDNKIISNKRIINRSKGIYFTNSVGEDGTEFDDLDKAHGVVRRRGKYGYINEFKEPLTPIMYDSLTNFIDGVACVSVNEKWSLIDETGNYITTGIYRYDPETNKTHNYRYAVIDKNQYKIIEAKELYGLKVGHADDTNIIWYKTRLEREKAKEAIYNIDNGYLPKVKTFVKSKN